MDAFDTVAQQPPPGPGCPQHRLSVAVLMRSWIPAPACPPPARVLMSSRGQETGLGFRARVQKGFTCRADVPAGPCTPSPLSVSWLFLPRGQSAASGCLLHLAFAALAV